MHFAHPEYLFLWLLLLPMAMWYFLFRRKREAALTVATTAAYRRPIRTGRTMLIHAPFLLRCGAFALLVVVLARPQTHYAIHESETEGVDIMMAMDISTSMLAQDVKPNRITAAKAVATEFINQRPHDNIGLVLFGGEAFLQCPLTTDHVALLAMLGHVSCDLQREGLLAPGTAIGMGLTNAVAHLENSKAISKVAILLTDGVNNTGEISPQMAAEAAKACGVRVYTISLGTDGNAMQTIATLPNGESYEAEVEQASNEGVLQMIADITGGKFFQANSKEELSKVYTEIDQLEKTKYMVLTYDRRYEAYAPFALGVFVLLLLEWLLRVTWLRRIP